MPGLPNQRLDSKAIRLTSRDEDLLLGLTGRFRLITTQLVANLWNSSAVYVRRRLGKLEAAGLVFSTRVLAHPLLDLEAPLVRWRPGEPEPNLGRVSHRLKARWTESQKLTTVYLPTKRTAHLHGGVGGRFDYPLQATHDLHVTALYVRLAAEDPERAAWWRGEEALRLGRKRGKICDALIVDSRERPTLAIEFGGSYRVDRVRAFHRVMNNRRLPYEIW